MSKRKALLEKMRLQQQEKIQKQSKTQENPVEASNQIKINQKNVAVVQEIKAQQLSNEAKVGEPINTKLVQAQQDSVAQVLDEVQEVEKCKESENKQICEEKQNKQPQEIEPGPTEDQCTAQDSVQSKKNAQSKKKEKKVNDQAVEIGAQEINQSNQEGGHKEGAKIEEEQKKKKEEEGTKKKQQKQQQIPQLDATNDHYQPVQVNSDHQSEQNQDDIPSEAHGNLQKIEKIELTREIDNKIQQEVTVKNQSVEIIQDPQHTKPIENINSTPPENQNGSPKEKLNQDKEKFVFEPQNLRLRQQKPQEQDQKQVLRESQEQLEIKQKDDVEQDFIEKQTDNIMDQSKQDDELLVVETQDENESDEDIIFQIKKSLRKQKRTSQNQQQNKLKNKQKTIQQQQENEKDNEDIDSEQQEDEDQEYKQRISQSEKSEVSEPLKIREKREIKKKSPTTKSDTKMNEQIKQTPQQLIERLIKGSQQSTKKPEDISQSIPIADQKITVEEEKKENVVENADQPEKIPIPLRQKSKRRKEKEEKEESNNLTSTSKSHDQKTKRDKSKKQTSQKQDSLKSPEKSVQVSESKQNHVQEIIEINEEKLSNGHESSANDSSQNLSNDGNLENEESVRKVSFDKSAKGNETESTQKVVQQESFSVINERRKRAEKTLKKLNKEAQYREIYEIFNLDANYFKQFKTITVKRIFYKIGDDVLVASIDDPQDDHIGKIQGIFQVQILSTVAIFIQVQWQKTRKKRNLV